MMFTVLICVCPPSLSSLTGTKFFLMHSRGPVSLTGREFQGEAGLLLSSMGLRFPHLVSDVWLSRAGMKLHGIEFTTPTPLAVRLDTRERHSCFQATAPQSLDETSRVLNGTDLDPQRKPPDDGLAVTLFNAAETTATPEFLANIGRQRATVASGEFLAASSGYMPLTIFRRPWAPYAAAIIREFASVNFLEESARPPFWATANQLHHLHGVLVDEYPSTATVEVPLRSTGERTLVYACTGPVATDDISNVDPRVIFLPLLTSFLATPLTLTHNVDGVFYSVSTSATLRRHLSLTLTEHKEFPVVCPRSAGPVHWNRALTDKIKYCYGVDEHRNRESVPSYFLPKCSRLPILPARWATGEHLSAMSVDPLPNSRPAMLSFDNSGDLELWNCALTTLDVSHVAFDYFTQFRNYGCSTDFEATDAAVREAFRKFEETLDF